VGEVLGRFHPEPSVAEGGVGAAGVRAVVMAEERE